MKLRSSQPRETSVRRFEFDCLRNSTFVPIRHSRDLEGSFPKTSKSDRCRRHTVSSKEA